MSIQLRMAAASVGALAALGVLAGSASATHAGAIADCGSAGTFIVKAQPNGAGFQSPTPNNAVLFEGGGGLTVFELWVNGRLDFSVADTGRAMNNVDEVTCSFANGDGVQYRATGILTAG